MNYPTEHYIDSVCEDPNVNGAYSAPPLGWFANEASVSSLLAVPHVFSEDVCQGKMITPIVGAPNRSRFLGNTDAAFYSGPALGPGDLYPTLSYDVAEVMASSSGRLPPGFVTHPLQPLSQSEQEWLSWAFDVALENILRSPAFPTSQTIVCEEYHPLTYMGPCPTLEPPKVDHFQQHQNTYVEYPYQAPVGVGNAVDQGGYGNHHPCPPSLPLPFRHSLHSPLPIPGHLSLPPEMPPHHTRPFHKGKDEIFKTYHTQPQDSFHEQDARLKPRYLKSPSPLKKTLSDGCT